MTKTAMVLLLVVSAVSMFASPRLQPFHTLCDPCHPIIGDFNGDDLDDFIGAYVHVHVYYAEDLYLNRGGSFDPGVGTAGLEGNLVVEGVGDFNADGLDDLVVMKPGSLIGHPAKFGTQGPHRLKINAGSGRFINGPALPGYVVQVTDFDADGRADLVLLAFDDSSQKQIGLTLARNQGDGTFALHQTLPFPDNKDSTTSPPFAVGDLNSDGRPDLVQQRGTYLHFYFAGADGKFAARRSRFTFVEPREPHIADVNGDGHADLVFISWFGRSRDARVTALFGDGAGRFPGASHLSIPFQSSDPENPPALANLAVADFHQGGANEIAVGVNAGHVMMLSAMGNQLQEVARLDLPANQTLVHAGRFRPTASADLLVNALVTSSSTVLVFAEGAVAPTLRQARDGSRARAVRRAVAAKTLDGDYDVRVQSSCTPNIPSEWTIIEEGLFVDFVTGSGLRIEGAMIDGGINARFFIDEGGRTRTFEGPLESVGNLLKGRFYEYDAPCGGRWATHDIEALR